MAKIDIPYYLDYLPKGLLKALDDAAEAHPQVQHLKISPPLMRDFPHIESPLALQVICDIYDEMKGHLNQVLTQRSIDRRSIDDTTRELVAKMGDIDYLSEAYPTVLGAKDTSGRVVAGPQPKAKGAEATEVKPVFVPPYLEGEQVTLFGPPDSGKMCINAMNSLHRRLPGEPEIVAKLVEESGQVPRWGADNEDSQTPIMASFLKSCENLIGCFEGTLAVDDKARGKSYRLAKEGLAQPIKRIPGLALPDGTHLYRGNPLPLHLFDFVLHLCHNWRRPEALVFYVPKLENEEEAAYLKALITKTEARIQALHPDYVLGTVKLFIVFESPRSIFRIREIADTLHPHFVGGSLGWHDFLGSTARLFKEDPNYRIPVKADPNIVINHIKESHLILVKALAPIGGITIGGMYGTLYEDGNPTSFEVSMVGYIKDVVTQLKRGLKGFWVAHPSFVRVGIALVEAWRRDEGKEQKATLEALVSALVPGSVEGPPLLAFIRGEDVPGLDESDPLYMRGVVAADIAESDVISNSDPQEVRYNLFQAVQYLTAWLTGNGCVALPALAQRATGEPVFVRIMDDLATTERSRWELWAEVFHGRVSEAEVMAILEEELDFIKGGVETDTKRVQIKWEGEAARWYPTAITLLKGLITSKNPPEFVTEWLMPFTLNVIREDPAPLERVRQLGGLTGLA